MQVIAVIELQVEQQRARGCPEIIARQLRCQYAAGAARRQPAAVEEQVAIADEERGAAIDPSKVIEAVQAGTQVDRSDDRSEVLDPILAAAADNRGTPGTRY